MKHFSKMISAALTLIIAIALLSSACAPNQSVVSAITPEPTATVAATPTPTPSPTPSATSTPTIELIHDLTDEEVQKEIELLGITVDPNEEVPMSNVFFVLCSQKEEQGNKDYFIEFAYLGIKQSTKTTVLAKIWNGEEIYEFPDNGSDNPVDALNGVLVSPRYESLFGTEVEMITGLFGIEYECREYGIKTKKIYTPIGKEIWASQNSYSSQLPFTYNEYADFYVRTFAEGNRMSAADYTNPIPYTPRTPTP